MIVSTVIMVQPQYFPFFVSLFPNCPHVHMCMIRTAVCLTEYYLFFY